MINRNDKKSLWRGSLFFVMATLFTVFLGACSDKSPLEVVEDDVDNAADAARFHYEGGDELTNLKCIFGEYYDYECCIFYGETCNYPQSSSSYMSESDKCYYGTSSYSDSWCCSNYGYRCNYVSSSSYKSSSSYRFSSSSVRSSSSVKVEVVEAHTSKTKTLKFSLTYYKQNTEGWDGTSRYNDGDPTISFTIYFIASGGQSNAKSTGNLISLQDQGTWSGVATKEIEVPVGTQDIKVCPSVIDKDVLDNDNKSSGNCYTITNVGYLEDYSTIEQSDSKTAIYTLKWEWYLY